MTLSSLLLSINYRMSSQQLGYGTTRECLACVRDAKLIILVHAGSEPNRPSPDSGGGVTIKWKEFGIGKYSGQGFVSFTVRLIPTELILALQPTKRIGHSYATTTYPPTHQQNSSCFVTNEWREWYSVNVGQRIKCRRVGRVPAHTWPEVFRLQ